MTARRAIDALYSRVEAATAAGRTVGALKRACLRPPLIGATFRRSPARLRRLSATLERLPYAHDGQAGARNRHARRSREALARITSGWYFSPMFAAPEQFSLACNRPILLYSYVYPLKEPLNNPSA